jgi:hypothetical protein
MNSDEIALFDQRVAMVRMTIRAVREVHTVISSRRFGKEPDMVMIGLVIFEGMASGRRRSKSAISRITGISRATLDRRLAALERDGHIVREGKGFVATPHKLNAPWRLHRTRGLITAFIQLGQELSNLDHK